MEFPEGGNGRMHALSTLEQFTANTCMSDIAIPKDRPRHSNGAFRVIGRFADAPLMLGVADVPRNWRSGGALKSIDPSRVQVHNLLARERFGLLADGVSCGDTLQAADDPFMICCRHVFGYLSKRIHGNATYDAFSTFRTYDFRCDDYSADIMAFIDHHDRDDRGLRDRCVRHYRRIPSREAGKHGFHCCRRVRCVGIDNNA
jgi:hypothetical protein